MSTSTIPQRLTHSRLKCFRACPRRHQLRYEYGLRREESGYAIKVGNGFHRAKEAIDKGEDVAAVIEAEMDDAYDMALVAAMVDAHTRRWANDPVTPLASELPYDLALVNPETGGVTQTWRVAGVIDRVVRLADGRIALMEYKTTSRDFSPGADYWTQLRFDQQIGMYVIAARAMGYDVQTILYDVTKRPAMRPLRATPADKRKFKKDGTLYANQRDRDETPEEFAARVAANIRDNIDAYFARIEIPRLDSDLVECQHEVWQQQKAIRSAQLLGHWYRNPQACFSPFQCNYLDICGRDDLEHETPDGYVRDADVHPELSAHATTGG